MMRLLSYDDDNNLQITRDLAESEVKPYAILSHTWYNDEEEVTFHEIGISASRQKPGFGKIDFCGKQARRDGWDHFWVDTCCIDKANHTELSRAITSMYRWYQQAQVCYVYLADVPSRSTLIEQDWQSTVRQSRWFTRGWTLQELLAPQKVVFYSKTWEHLGTKEELKELLHDITGIPIAVLEGQPLSQSSVSERMRWTQGRQTKEKEDQAYCLLGIFGVYMYLNYGEGDNAFRRLQKELDTHSAVARSADDHDVQQSTAFKIGLDLTKAPIIEDNLFIGRLPELREMENVLCPENQGQEHRRLVLGGMGGVGKTQLAIVYAKRRCRLYDTIFWLSAASETALKQSMYEMAERVLDPKSLKGLNDDERQPRVTRWLSDNQNTRWLLILDNYDEPDAFDLGKYCPYGAHGSAIITTRLPDQVKGQKLLLKPLGDIEHSLDILSTRSRRSGVHSDPYARKLADRMQGLPLALSTAGAFLCKSTWTFERYLQEYDERWNIHSRRPLQLQEYQDRTLYTTWDVSYQRLEVVDADAARLLKLLAYFDNQHVWFELLHGGIQNETPDWLKNIMTDAADFEDVMRLLTDYCFVELQSATQSYSIHACVHDYANACLNRQMDKDYYLYAFNCVANSITDMDQDQLAYLRYSKIAPHARRLAHKNFKELANQKSLDVLDTTVSIGDFLQHQIEFNAAEEMYCRALAGYEEIYGVDRSSTLRVSSSLGMLYHKQGKLAEAEQLFDRALAGEESTVGPDHIFTFDICHNLGNLYVSQGKLSKAEQMFVRALAGCQKARGPEHTSTLDTVSELGNLYRKQGKLAEAELMFSRALTGKEKALGPNHASTIDMVTHLGVLYYHQDKLAEAEQMYKRALAGYEKVLGAEHTSTINIYFNFASVYSKQGKLADAEQMLLRALAGYEKAFGTEHATTLDTVAHLGMHYRKQGKLEVAEEMLLRALAGHEKALGTEHTTTLRTVNNLGNLYMSQGKLSKAEPLFVRAMAGHESFESMNNLAMIYGQQGKLDAAEDLFARALAGHEKALGAEHTTTLETLGNLGTLNRMQGKLERAEEMFKRALAGYEKSGGIDYPSGLDAIYNLGLLYVLQGRLIEAKQFLQRAATGMQKTLGPDHPKTKAATGLMARLSLVTTFSR